MTGNHRKRASSVDENDPLVQASVVIEADRAQLAHEIHDGLVPYLFVSRAAVERELDQLHQFRSKADAKNVSQETLDDWLKERQQTMTQLEAWINEAMRIGRGLLSQAYLPNFETSNWASEAKLLIEKLHGDQCQIEWQGLEPCVTNSPDQSTAIYRMVIEAIRNAIRHGKPSKVCVTGALEPEGACQVCVKDDGVGFNPTKLPEDRFGIHGMKQRGQLANVQVAINSSPGGPTEIIFRWTINKTSK